MSSIFLQHFPNDSGPIYQETMAGRFPVEPWNTASNAIFLLIIIYFAIKIYHSKAPHRFMVRVLWVIGASYIGGTMYHATRSHEIWLLLDWVPIIFLLIAAVYYFFSKIALSTTKKLLFFSSLIALSFMVRWLPLPKIISASFGYIASVAPIAVPTVWYLSKTKWKNGYLVLLAFLSFGIAITFRSLDGNYELLPMGTHWLWHSFGGVAVFLFLSYIYRDEEYAFAKA